MKLTTLALKLQMQAINNNNMKQQFTLSFLFLLCIIAASAQQRGFKPVSIKINGQESSLYGQSHALVIGNSNYTNGWAWLPGVENDVNEVKTALETNGFHVLVEHDLTKEQMDKSITEFISQYGQDKDNRLLIYYAGHGHTIRPQWASKEEDNIGYLVPVDAPKPNDNQGAFQSKAIEMIDVEKYALRTGSKHLLFLFDACFAGSVFAMNRAAPAVIDYKTKMPVRQIISAGSANETVPDKSIFCRQFVAAITTADADYNKDGYLTGSELGEFLQTTVVNYSRNSQHPQYGKIRNPNLDKGDFVFVLPTGQPSGNESTTTTTSPLDNETPPARKKIEVEEESLVAYGSIEINAEMDGDIYLDNAFIKKASANNKITLRNIETGKHTFEIRGSSPFSETIQVEKDRKTLINAKSANTAGYTETTSGLNLEMIFVEGGFFYMGSNNGDVDEKPVHTVQVGSLYIGKCEVTQAQWRTVMGSNPSFHKDCDNCPVEQVSWDDAQKFISKLNQMTGKQYSLPTEAEWEYAARGGQKSKGYTYSGSNSLGDVGWYNDNSGPATHPVAQKQANELGIYDMSGNVWEWCNDWYKGYPGSSGVTDYTGSLRVFRGGCWIYDARDCRSANRDDYSPAGRGIIVGFRLASPK